MDEGQEETDQRGDADELGEDVIGGKAALRDLHETTMTRSVPVRRGWRPTTSMSDGTESVCVI